ncbi:HlyC/CorC family transporter [Candidatus Saccharibacteria bacterium]|nr:HlyC/CorC family transporter [Candidatus Saccharibacteria bacterium]
MELWFLLLAIILILVCGAFVAAEFALLAVNRSTVERLAESGDKSAIGIMHALRSLSTQLSSVQIGITVTNLGIGYLSEPSIAQLIAPSLWWVHPNSLTVHAIATVLAITIATAVTMVIGELVPKNIAIISPLATLRILQRPLRLFTLTALPFIKVLNGSANAYLRSRGVAPQEELLSARSADELLSLVRRSAEKGTLTKKTALMLERSLNFRELTAVDIMTPRIQVKVLKHTALADQVVRLSKQTGLSRFPVYEGTVDNIVGVVRLKHVMEVPRSNRADVQVNELMVSPLYVPSTIKLGPLLEKLKQGMPHMAIAVDEFGGFDGVVTMEDLLEELVGDVYDEHDADDNLAIRKIALRTWSISGLVRPDEIAQSLGYFLPEEDDVETVGGLCMHELERVPKKGDLVTISAVDRKGRTIEVRMKVQKMEGRRVDGLIMTFGRPLKEEDI